MSETTKTESSGNSKMQTLLAWAICALMFIVVTFLLFYEIPPGNKEIVGIIIGSLVIILKDVYGFNFGSSFGSYKKDDRQAVLQDQIIKKDERQAILQEQIIKKDELLLKKENGSLPDMLGQTKAALFARIKDKDWEQELTPMIQSAATMGETIILQALITDKEGGIK